MGAMRARRTLAAIAGLVLFAGCTGDPQEGGTTLVLSDAVELTPAVSYTDPAWSPDSATVSFSGPRYRGLYSVPATGGTTHAIAPRSVVSGFRHHWLDEPARILCPARGRHAAVEVEASGRVLRDVAQPVELAYLDADEQVWVRGEAEDVQVTSGDDRFYEVVPSPDGARIAAVGLVTGIQVIDAAVGSTPVTVDGTHPAWTPDGRFLLFERTADDGHVLTGSDLWAFDVAGGTLINLTQTLDRIEVHPAVAPDGHSLAFVRDGAVWVARVEEVTP